MNNPVKKFKKNFKKLNYNFTSIFHKNVLKRFNTESKNIIKNSQHFVSVPCIYQYPLILSKSSEYNNFFFIPILCFACMPSVVITSFTSIKINNDRKQKGNILLFKFNKRTYSVINSTKFCLFYALRKIIFVVFTRFCVLRSVKKGREQKS